MNEYLFSFHRSRAIDLIRALIKVRQTKHTDHQKVRLYRLISINMVAVDTMSLLNDGGLVQVFLMMSWKRV
jgi:hypothetical protein